MLLDRITRLGCATAPSIPLSASTGGHACNLRPNPASKRSFRGDLKPTSPGSPREHFALLRAQPR
eukprot:7333141-Alexandrium_andersonii.AAC.1